MAGSPQRVRKQIDVARQADAIRLADDVDVKGCAAHTKRGIVQCGTAQLTKHGLRSYFPGATCLARRSACRLPAPTARVAPSVPECRRACGRARAPAPRAA